jgi:hypothetical protein
MERLLAGLDSRVFLMNNVHDDAPVVFRTRWALSYLSGPPTRDQIKRLTARQPVAPATPVAPAQASAAAAPEPAPALRPTVPDGINERFLPVTRPPGPGERLLYRAELGAVATLHYARATVGVDEWEQVVLLAPLAVRGESPWL